MYWDTAELVVSQLQPAYEGAVCQLDEAYPDRLFVQGQLVETQYIVVLHDISSSHVSQS
jgi:hypothetical protein